MVSLPFLINVDRFRPTLQSDLSDALGREVTLGNLHLSVLSDEVTADDLSVAEDPAFGKPAFIRAKSMHVGVEILPFLMSRKLIVTDLLIDQPEIALVQAPSGDWNFSGLGSKSKAASTGPKPPERLPLDLSVKLVKISNGRMTLRRTVGHWKPVTLEQVNIELRDFSSTSVFPFSLSAQPNGGGTIALDGKAGPINPSDSAMTPVKVTLKTTGLDLVKSGMNDVAPAVSGAASFDGSGESDGIAMRLEGKLKLDSLKLAKSVWYAFHSSGGSGLLRATRSSQARRNCPSGRFSRRLRDRAPYWKLCRAGRFHGVEPETFGARDAGAGVGSVTAGAGDHAALRNVAERRDGKRRSIDGRPGGSAGHYRFIVAQ